MNREQGRLVEWLRRTRRVIAFCGAGVSAESGVPTFRGPGGLWEGHRVEDVATPQAFARDPQFVWRFYALRQEALPAVEPNPAHRVLAQMEARFPEFLVVSQNVDNLHERAGSRKLIKLHGSLMEVRCTRCDTVTPLTAPVSSAAVERGDLPHCTCGGLQRPNVVWFGEYLNLTHLDQIDEFFQAQPNRAGATAGPEIPGVLLVIGTSGLVSGGYGFPLLARRSGFKSVEINPEASALSSEMNLVIRDPAGACLATVWREISTE